MNGKDIYKDMKVSVIVPVYNTENYLRKCLDSLVNQTFKDFEVIVVNDGSSDNSQNIINEYISKYPFIKAFRKENGGISSARNTGLNYATGEYIAFVDSDDYVEMFFLEKMYEKAINSNSDVVICDYYALNEKEKRKVSCHMNMSPDDKIEFLLSPPMVWSKLIKKSFFDKVRFTEGLFYEDLDICVRMLPLVNKVSFVDEPLYDYYLQHSGSAMTQTTFNTHLLDIFTVLENSKKLLELNYYREIEYIYITHLLRTATLRFLDYPNTLEYLTRINGTMERTFPNWRENEYYNKCSYKVKAICFLAIHRMYFILKLIKKITGRR